MLMTGVHLGHKVQDCKEKRVFDLNDVPDKLPEEAWKLMQVASEERDLEDFRTVRMRLAFLNINVFP